MTGPINDQVVSLVCAQLLYLKSENPKKDIAFYINSPGGVVSSGLAIYDTMPYIRPDVSTLSIGLVDPTGTLLIPLAEMIDGNDVGEGIENIILKSL